MMREFCGEFRVLVPYKAQSAGTMVTLGADRIVAGRKAELSPIDPTLARGQTGRGDSEPQQVGVEDVSSYISFMRERAGISDQAALAEVVSQLASQIGPVSLGRVHREYSHIRLVARKLLASRVEKLEEDRIDSITDALTAKMYSHGHSIGRAEARDLGLPIEEPSVELEGLMWQLYEEYESFFGLREPKDPEMELRSKGKDEVEFTDVPVAVIQSANKLDVFRLNWRTRFNRAVPSNPTINVSLNLALPPGLDLSKQPEAGSALNQMLGEVNKAVPGIVHKELVRQSPVVGFEVRGYGGRWVEEAVPKVKRERTKKEAVAVAGAETKGGE
jgi:hypothetical protein